MNPKSWQELEQSFKAEIQGWMTTYPSKPFVDRIIKRVFSYYDRSLKKPDSREGWQRAIDSFLRSDWEKEIAAAAAAIPLVAKREEARASAGELRAKLSAFSGRGIAGCPKCLGYGTVSGYRKSSLTCVTFACNCMAGELAMQLPEYSGKIRPYTQFDPEQWDFDF